MPPSNNRIFIPVAVWHTPRGDVELQREIHPAQLPAVDIGGAGRGWLDKQAIVLPYSTKWEAARAAAVDIMGRTNGFAL